jgi:type II restriction enzyme
MNPLDYSSLIANYTSNAQKARVISEAWISQNGYCLLCDSEKLVQTAANTKTKDFVCPACAHGYELKSKLGVFGTRIIDGAFSAMMTTIHEGRTPSFLLLEYSVLWEVKGLTAIHHSLITETCIEERKPLSTTARRAGWVGCNIVLPKIAIDGRIPLVIQGIPQQHQAPRTAFARLEFLSRMPTRQRGWTASLLNLLRQLTTDQFDLEDAYGFERELSKLFPSNRNVRPKIRQQLQILRDAGLINFLGNGRYEFASQQ